LDKPQVGAAAGSRRIFALMPRLVVEPEIQLGLRADSFFYFDLRILLLSGAS
jgi:hypothetical protein